MSSYPNIRTPSVNQEISTIDRVTRTQFDYGSSRSRLRFLRAKSLLDASVVLTQIEFNLFVNWFDVTINSGRDYFTLLIDTGNGSENIQCKFTEIYNATRSGRLWNVKLMLEVAQTSPQITPLSQSEIDAFLTWGANDFGVFEPIFNDVINNLNGVWDV